MLKYGCKGTKKNWNMQISLHFFFAKLKVCAQEQRDPEYYFGKQTKLFERRLINDLLI